MCTTSHTHKCLFACALSPTVAWCRIFVLPQVQAEDIHTKVIVSTFSCLARPNQPSSNEIITFQEFLGLLILP